MAEFVHTEFNNGVFIITLDHPKVNALNLEMVKSLQAAFKQAAQNAQARVVLLRGAGDTFSAGQDVYEILKAEGASYRKHMLDTYNPLVMQIRQLNLPILAEIRGTVAGAALGLVLACDLRIASNDARFIVGFLVIGLGRATEMAFTNAPITAQQALSWGLINRVVPPEPLQTSVYEMAKQ